MGLTDKQYNALSAVDQKAYASDIASMTHNQKVMGQIAPYVGAAQAVVQLGGAINAMVQGDRIIDAKLEMVKSDLKYREDLLQTQSTVAMKTLDVQDKISKRTTELQKHAVDTAARYDYKKFDRGQQTKEFALQQNARKEIFATSGYRNAYNNGRPYRRLG